MSMKYWTLASTNTVSAIGSELREILKESIEDALNKGTICTEDYDSLMKILGEKKCSSD